MKPPIHLAKPKELGIGPQTMPMLETIVAVLRFQKRTKHIHGLNQTHFSCGKKYLQTKTKHHVYINTYTYIILYVCVYKCKKMTT